MNRWFRPGCLYVALALLGGIGWLPGCTAQHPTAEIGDAAASEAPDRAAPVSRLHDERPAPTGSVSASDRAPLDPTWGRTGAFEPGGVNLVDVTASSQIAFRHTDGGSGRRYIVETVVAGLALFDYDGDGWIDMYFLNGAPLPGTVVEETPRNALYRNNGDWTFTDVTEAAGVGDAGYGMGVAVGDFDNDGDPDLYVNNFGPNVFYANNGDGTFREATAAAGVGCDDVGAGAAFLDIDHDGHLDLYVANYVNFTFDRYKTRTIGAFEYPAGPTDYQPQPDRLFRNNGDGTFADVSQASGIARVAGPSMGVVCADLDDDRDTDIFVCCDNAANLLFRNDGAGRFEEIALVAGVAYDFDGGDNGNMGVDCGDYDNDGRLDLFVTTYQGELAVLYRNLGGGLFQDVTPAAGIGASSYPHVKWGTTLADFDHDGDRDAFIACGHFMDNIRHIDDRTDVRVPNFLLANQGNGKFVDVSQQSGTGLAVVACSKGAGFDDLDGDGDLDGVVLNVNAPPTLLRNDTPNLPPSLQILLRGTQANRDGVGARVRVTAGGRTQIAEVYGGRGYQSHFGAQLHFGLGDAPRVERLEIWWPGGQIETIDQPPQAPALLVVEGQGATPRGGVPSP